MGYVDRALVSGESVLHEARFHWLDKLTAGCLCLVVVGLPWVLSMWTTEVVVTTRRVIYKRGWIARRTEELGLRRIEEVNLRQGIAGRLLGYGRVYIQGMGGSDIALPSLADPMGFKHALQEAQVQAERVASAVPGRE